MLLNIQGVQHNTKSNDTVRVGSNGDFQRKSENYEVEGWPKSRNRTTDLYLRYEDESALIKPILKGEQNILYKYIITYINTFINSETDSISDKGKVLI